MEGLSAGLPGSVLALDRWTGPFSPTEMGFRETAQGMGATS